MPETPENRYVAANVYVAETVAGLRLFQGGADTNAKNLAVLLGSTAAFDQALKLYAWDPASEDADTGTTFVKPTAVTGAGRWRAPA